MKDYFDFAIMAGAVVLIALMMFGSWGIVIIVLVALVLFLGWVAFTAIEAQHRLRGDSARVAELENQLAVANDTIQKAARDYELNARSWEQQLAKYEADVRSLEAENARDVRSLEAKLTRKVRSLEAELAQKEKLIEALKQNSPPIPKADDDAIKKLFR